MKGLVRADYVLGAGNPLSLPIGADVVISKSHCDAKPAAGATPSTTSSAITSSPTPTPNGTKTSTGGLSSLLGIGALNGGPGGLKLLNFGLLGLN